MKITTALTTFVLLIAPGLAAAQCMGDAHKSQTAMSCAEGTMLDPETGLCLPTVTG